MEARPTKTKERVRVKARAMVHGQTGPIPNQTLTMIKEKGKVKAKVKMQSKLSLHLKTLWLNSNLRLNLKSQLSSLWKTCRLLEPDCEKLASWWRNKPLPSPTPTRRLQKLFALNVKKAIHAVREETSLHSQTSSSWTAWGCQEGQEGQEVQAREREAFGGSRSQTPAIHAQSPGDQKNLSASGLRLRRRNTKARLQSPRRRSSRIWLVKLGKSLETKATTILTAWWEKIALGVGQPSKTFYLERNSEKLFWGWLQDANLVQYLWCVCLFVNELWPKEKGGYVQLRS